MRTHAVQIRVERSGGIAGLTRTAEVSDPETVRRLLECVSLSGHPERAKPLADGFSYRLVIERGPSESAPEVVELTEHAFPADMRRDIDALLRNTG